MESTLTLELPTSTILHVNIEQFCAIASANRDLRLERTCVGELIVNPPTGGESGNPHSALQIEVSTITQGMLDWHEKNISNIISTFKTISVGLGIKA